MGPALSKPVGYSKPWMNEQQNSFPHECQRKCSVSMKRAEIEFSPFRQLHVDFDSLPTHHTNLEDKCLFGIC
jgi:hypothetical protein